MIMYSRVPVADVNLENRSADDDDDYDLAKKRKKRSSLISSSSTIITVLMIQVVVFGVVLGCAYIAIVRPPPPKFLGSPGGLTVTSPRVRLPDGRHLAYKETGVPRIVAKHIIIIVHGIADTKDIQLPLSQEMLEELQVCLLTYDRAGYGDSDTYRKRSVKSEAYDIRDLADQLEIDKFFLLGYSAGSSAGYSCLYYIPDRLSGVAIVSSHLNYWWPCFPKKLARDALRTMLYKDQWMFSVAHHTPWLFYWWMTQDLFSPSGIMEGDTFIVSQMDDDIWRIKTPDPLAKLEKERQQGDYESLYLDILAGFGEWEFDPTDLVNPFPNDEGSVHLWQGAIDVVVPINLTRHIVEKVPWIRYHEVPGGGHYFIFNDTICENIIRSLLFG